MVFNEEEVFIQRRCEGNNRHDMLDLSQFLPDEMKELSLPRVAELCPGWAAARRSTNRSILVNIVEHLEDHVHES